MFNPTASLQKGASPLRRLALTTKMTNKGYYKGNRVGSMGKLTKHGNFIVDYAKVRTYVVPHGLKDSILTPFVTKVIEKDELQYLKVQNPTSGDAYLEKWKMENGSD
ncbi:hypothetical protein GQ43DRAFT_411785 [Delitschia confertaspora ATCC 74209]|uniref:Ribosomal protein L27 n=1 Tax=Delitschia confertaspora ATCC 74209 TaxID=1513339 RepID=A0A9P4N114_9PLEO|nr:hypothetical protein GQ43DRAFT_411785 [Delitschia confertaspora ATCC 74209]